MPVSGNASSAANLRLWRYCSVFSSQAQSNWEAGRERKLIGLSASGTAAAFDTTGKLLRASNAVDLVPRPKGSGELSEV